jgi:hypothetical protein
MYYGFRLAQYHNFLQISHLLKQNRLQKELKLLVISREQLPLIHWNGNKKEFELQGKHYDVAKTRLFKGDLYAYCFPDEKENQLVVFYNQKKSGNQPLNNIVSKILLITCIVPQLKDGIFPVVTDYDFNYYYYFSVSSFSDIHSPPPKQNQLT